MGILLEEFEKMQSGEKRKWEVLKEHEADIRAMFKRKVPMTKQIEAILASGILEKLTYAEYYHILKWHFGYIGKGKFASPAKVQKVDSEKAGEEKRKNQVSKKAKKSSASRPSALADPVEVLAEGVDLL